jgi:YfiH family protein
MLQPLLADSLACLPRIAHGFFTRAGGVSGGIYASLNCGIGSRDDPGAVRENRARVVAHLGAHDLVTAHQVHSATAIVAEHPWRPEHRPHCDAIVTRTRGLAIGVLAADCAPVLFADAQAGVIGVAHAGWRGALGGVLEASLDAMLRAGAGRDRIIAAVGPCIGSHSYEVGPEFEAEFLAQASENARFFVRPEAADRPRFDLAGYVMHRLTRAGIRAELRAPCTFTASEQFFSYRRSRAEAQNDYGRQISTFANEGTCARKGRAKFSPIESGRRDCQRLGNPMGYPPSCHQPQGLYVGSPVQWVHLEGGRHRDDHGRCCGAAPAPCAGACRHCRAVPWPCGL